MEDKKGFNFSYSKKEEKTQLNEVDKIELKEFKKNQMLFLEKFQNNVKNLKKIFHPMQKKDLKVVYKKLDINFRDIGNLEIQDLIKNNTVEIKFPIKKSIFGSKSELFAIATSALKIENNNPAKIDIEFLKESLKLLSLEDNNYYYIGVFSFYGIEEEILKSINMKKNITLVILWIDEKNRLFVKTDDRDFSKKILDIFEIESMEEKVENTINYIKSLPVLQIKGNYININEIKENLNISEKILDTAISKLIIEDSDLTREYIEGIHILKRKRL